MSIQIGSLFSGIGGFELGIERAIPNSETIWQVEQNKYCQTILKKHWPKAEIFDDVTQVNFNNLKPIDILIGGFPCQDISNAGKKEGIHAGKKSSLYWEMHRIICEIRPRVVIMENVSALVNRGLSDILRSLAQIGYDAEWTCITASMFGAPHRRERVFIVAYPHSTLSKRNRQSVRIHKKHAVFNNKFHSAQYAYWGKATNESPICGLDDGVSDRLARLKALGNSIVPQCSQWIGEQVYKSGILSL